MSDLHKIILQKCSAEIKDRKELYDNEVQTLLSAQLYPSLLANDSQCEDELVPTVLTKYTNICSEYREKCKEMLQDRRMVVETSSHNVYSYPLLIPCEWVHTFLESMEFLRYNNISTRISFLENRLYRTIEIFSSASSLPKSRIKHKTYTLDLPYHLCRFLSLFGTLIFTPVEQDKEQFSGTSKKFTDIELLVHFAIKLKNENLYKEFLKNELQFYKKKSVLIKELLEEAINAIIETLPSEKKEICFGAKKSGDIKLYQRVNEKSTTDDNSTLSPNTVLHYKTYTFPVHPAIVTILRSFVLADIEQYRIDRTKAIIQNTKNEFEEKYFEYIYSPFGKFLNFDRKALNEFQSLESSVKYKNLPTARNLYLEISHMPCMAKIYAFLAQAAFALRKVSDPVNGKTINLSILLDKIIFVGDTVGYPETISYMSVFEAFPGLFYFNFLNDFIENPRCAPSEIIKNICTLFEYYTGFISRLNKTKSKDIYMVDFIKPDNIRWISMENILSILRVNEKPIYDVMCNFINDSKTNREPLLNKEKQLDNFTKPKTNVISTSLKIHEAYKSIDPVVKFQTFFLTPITMTIEEVKDIQHK